MRDAIGGVFILQAILVFMIVVNAFLAFSVNYTKAFRAKNEIRSIIEKYEGLTCDALEQIELTLADNRYRLGRGNTCPDGYDTALGKDSTPLFCYKIQLVDIAGTSKGASYYKGAYYTVLTFVNLNIPVFDKMMNYTPFAHLFTVKGETALIYSSGKDHSGITQGRCAVTTKISGTECGPGFHYNATTGTCVDD